MKVFPLILAVLLTSNVSASDIDEILFHVDDYRGHLIVRNERMLNSTHQNEEGFSNFMSSLGYVREEIVVIDDGVVTPKCPEGAGNLCPLACLQEEFKFPTDNGLFQIKVDVNIMDIVNTQFAEAANGNDVLLPSVFNGEVIFPGLFTGQGEDKISKSEIAKDSCSHLEFIGGRTIGAALQYGTRSMCVAVNPCTHTYGVAQSGILPSIPLFNPPIGTFDINSIGFSMEKKLALTSGNEMFDGGFVTVHGHIALSGTGTIGIDLKREQGEPFAILEQSVTTSLIIDLDPLNNGVVPQTDAVDFAFLLSGKTNTPVLTLNLDEEGKNQVKIDLPDMLEAMADLHVAVKGEDDTFVDFSSTGSITLYDLCKIALPLAPICVLFDDVTFIASAKMKAGVKDGIGTFGMSFAIEADKPLEWSIDVMNELGNPTASFGISLELHGGRLEACIQFAHHDRVCPDFCQENAECGFGYYCQGDEIAYVGVCRPLNPLGAHCILDEVCETKKCSSYALNGECECEHDHHCEVHDDAEIHDGEHVWGVNKDDAIYYRNGLSGNWQRIDGSKKQIAVSADGEHVWGVNKDDAIYYRNGLSGNWERINGSLKQVAVSGDGERVWGVNIHDHIYYRNGRSGDWRRISGLLKQVAVSGDGEHVWGVNTHDHIYYSNGVSDIYDSNGASGNWQRIDGSLKQVAVSGYGGHVWGVNTHDHIYYRNGVSGRWQRVDGSKKEIAVSGGYKDMTDQKICIGYEYSKNECEHKNLEVGMDCGEDRQCLSGNCFNDVGDHMCQCSNDGHCPGTQRCKEFLFGANYCFTPGPIGDHCLINNDCMSDKCSSHLLNGECECNRDSHCSGSNICIYYQYSSNECEPKNLGLGASCGEDRQCNSMNCFTGLGYHTCQCGNDNHCPHECNTLTFGANECWEEPFWSFW